MSRSSRALLTTLLLAIVLPILACPSDGDENFWRKRRRLGWPRSQDKPGETIVEEPPSDSSATLPLHEDTPVALPCQHIHNETERDLLNEAFIEWRRRFGRRRNLQDLQYPVPVEFKVFIPEEGSVKHTMTNATADRLMTTLQQGFADTPFNYWLSKLEHIVDKDYAQCKRLDELRSTHASLRSDVMVVYFCNMYRKQVIGTTYTPVITVDFLEQDGIVLMNPMLAPEEDQLLLQHVLVHETGHWHGLLHTWEDRCSGEASWQRKYGGIEYYWQTGDGVEDTPAHFDATWSYPGEATCWRNPRTMETELDTCREDQGEDQGLDPVDNYMNYISGRCFDLYGHFTNGQIERMIAQYETYRLRDDTLVEAEEAPVPVNVHPSIRVCHGPGSDCIESDVCCGQMQCIEDDSGHGRCMFCDAQGTACQSDLDCCSNNCSDAGACQ